MEQNIENTIEENLKKLAEFGKISAEQAEVQNQALKITSATDSDNTPNPLLC